MSPVEGAATASFHLVYTTRVVRIYCVEIEELRSLPNSSQSY